MRNHIVRDQSSWQGAGFGMFATYENDVSRVVIVSVDRGDGPVRVLLPSDLRDDAERLAVVPSQASASELAQSVLDHVGDDDATATVEVRKVVLHGNRPLLLDLEPLVSGSAPR